MGRSARDLGWVRDPGLNFPEFNYWCLEYGRRLFWELQAWARSDRLSRGEKRRARRAAHALYKFATDLDRTSDVAAGLAEGEPVLDSLDLALGEAEELAVRAWGNAGTARYRRRAAGLEASANRLIERLEEISGPIDRAPASAVRDARRTRGDSAEVIERASDGVGEGSELSEEQGSGRLRAYGAGEGGWDDGWENP